MSDGLCPFARHRIIPPGSNDPAITPRVAILHVDAGNAESLYDFFKNRSGGIESHFHVQRDGGLEQYRGIYDQADANHLANDFAVSIETQGFGAGEWTAEQLATIKRLLLWLRDEAGIPLRKIDRWDGSGVGYHTLFGAPSHWTPVAKTCPGPERIRQFDDVLVPWMSDPEGDDMPITDADAQKIAEAVRKELHGGEQSRFQRLRDTLRNVNGNLRDLETAVADDATRAQVRRIRQALTAAESETETDAPRG